MVICDVLKEIDKMRGRTQVRRNSITNTNTPTDEKSNLGFPVMNIIAIYSVTSLFLQQDRRRECITDDEQTNVFQGSVYFTTLTIKMSLESRKQQQ